MTRVRLEPAAPQSRVKHSTTEPLCSPFEPCQKLMLLLSLMLNVQSITAVDGKFCDIFLDLGYDKAMASLCRYTGSLDPSLMQSVPKSHVLNQIPSFPITL